MLTGNLIPTQALVLANKSVYGDPRGKGGQASDVWKKANLIYITPPFPMHMDKTPITRIQVHKAAAPNFMAVFQSLMQRSNGHLPTLEEWGVTRFSGAFNYRPMRGLDTLSMHSYGCAIDLDAGNNMLGDATPRFAKYPHVLNAFKEAGFTWGGDWDGDGSMADQRRHDGMHWQLTQPIK